MTTDQKTIGISERLFIDHYPLVIERSADAHGSTRLVTDATGKVVQDMNYDAFGNALGFSAATALTTYLYDSMPFDAASGNYYDHARFYDAGTGGFAQADYGYTGSLANPMTGLPYIYGGGDPINMMDLNGHDFSLPDTLASFAINSVLTSAISNVVAPFASDAAALLIPPSLLMALETAGAPDAVDFGIEATAGGQYKGFGGFAVGGLELLASPKTGNAALFGYWGGGVSYSFGGGTGLSGAIAGSLGLVWGTPSSRVYAGRAIEVSVPFGSLPAGFRAKVERDLAESTASSSFLTEAESRLMTSAGWSSSMVDDYQWQAMKDALARSNWLLSRLDSLSVNIFSSFPTDGSGLGVSFGLDIVGGATAGASEGIAFGYTNYTQLAPQQVVTFA